MKSSKLTGFGVAAIAAAAFVFAPITSALAADDATASTGVKCAGINACKGQGKCGSGSGSASNSCSGKNDCKGKGWVMKDSEKACTDAGGTVIKEDKTDAPK